MRLSTLSCLVWSVSIASSRFVDNQRPDQSVLNPPFDKPETLYLLEFAPGQTQWTTEAEKWRLKRVSVTCPIYSHIFDRIQDGLFFMDITNYRELGNLRNQIARGSTYPADVFLESEINLLIQDLNKTYIQSHLEYLTTFHNRYYNSTYGEASYHWLLSTIITTSNQSFPLSRSCSSAVILSKRQY